jgi:hypothetical protein
MKYQVIKLLVVMMLFASSVKAEGQLLIRVSAGYGLGTQKLIMDEIYTNTTTENVYGTFGGNWGFTVGAGLELSKYIDFGLDLGYQNGRSVVIPDAHYPKTFTGRLILLSPSLTFKTDLDNNFTPYARIGLFTGYPLTKVNFYGSDNKFRGGFPLGVNEAIGAFYNVSNSIKLFAEIANQSMIYKPTRKIEADGKKVKFLDVLPYPAPSNEEITHHFFSFGAVGLNIGVKIIL